MALSLADELAAERTRPGPRCRFADWLSDDERQALEDDGRPLYVHIVEAFQRDDVPSMPLSKWLGKKGVEMSRMLVDHHRRAQCATCADAGHDLKRRRA